VYVQERRGLPKNAYWSPQRTDDWPLMRMKIVKTDDAMMIERERVVRVELGAEAAGVLHAEEPGVQVEHAQSSGLRRRLPRDPRVPQTNGSDLRKCALSRKSTTHAASTSARRASAL
jgi:hypothetical protein